MENYLTAPENVVFVNDDKMMMESTNRKRWSNCARCGEVNVQENHFVIKMVGLQSRIFCHKYQSN